MHTKCGMWSNSQRHQSDICTASLPLGVALLTMPPASNTCQLFEPQNLARTERTSAGGADVSLGILELFRRLADLDGNELYAARAKLSAEIRQVVKRIRVYPGGYFMTVDEFIHAHPEEDHEEARWQCLMTPDKKGRFAMIEGVNGKSVPTYTPAEARFKGMTQKADLLELLGLS